MTPTHNGSSGQEKSKNMWQKNCPICRQPMEKKSPTETVACPCGKYIWKG